MCVVCVSVCVLVWGFYRVGCVGVGLCICVCVRGCIRFGSRFLLSMKWLLDVSIIIFLRGLRCGTLYS